MRRIWTAVAVVIAISLVGGSAWAGGAHIDVPASVTQGDKLTVEVEDCESGPGFTAFVRVEIEDSNGNLVQSKQVHADDDGTTQVKIRIRASRYPLGRYLAVVICIHLFADGGEGIFFESGEHFRVRAA